MSYDSNNAANTFTRNITATVYEETSGLYRAKVALRRGQTASGIGGTPRSAVRQALAEMWCEHRYAAARATGAPSLTCHRGFTKGAQHNSLPINLVGCSDYEPAVITL
jgi:acyl-homoserine lactone acylase PvdQ